MEYICPYCKKKLNSGKALGGHKTKCKLSPSFNSNKGKKLNSSPRNIFIDNLYCQYCGSKRKNNNALIQHEIRCKKNPNRINCDKEKGKCNIPLEKRGWSKGLTKETDIRILNNSIAISAHYENCDRTFKDKHHTADTKEYLSKNALENNFEKHFGSHKSYSYNGVKFISSYELNVAIDLDKNNIKWLKPSRLPYIDNNGKKHHYTADFYLPDYNVYLDPKNDYLIENINPKMGYSDKQKIDWVMKQNNVIVIILNKNELTWQNIKEKIDLL